MKKRTLTGLACFAIAGLVALPVAFGNKAADQQQPLADNIAVRLAQKPDFSNVPALTMPQSSPAKLTTDTVAYWKDVSEYYYYAQTQELSSWNDGYWTIKNNYTSGFAVIVTENVNFNEAPTLVTLNVSASAPCKIWLGFMTLGCENSEFNYWSVGSVTFTEDNLEYTDIRFQTDPEIEYLTQIENYHGIFAYIEGEAGTSFTLSNVKFYQQHYKIETIYDSVTVNVATPGTFGQVMVQNIENWSDVGSLIITGSLNDDDMQYLSRLINLTTLDLSQTDITTIGGCNSLQKLQTVILPQTVRKVADNAFEYCKALCNINLETIQEIGKYAFQSCNSMSANLSLPAVRTIGDDAFYYNKAIASVDMPVAETIGLNAFYHSSVNTVNMPAVSSIGKAAFYETNLREAIIPCCNTLEYGAFEYCTNLKKVVFSDQLETIPSYAFYRCPIESVTLPSALNKISNYAFCNCKLKSIDIPEGVKTIEERAFCYNPLMIITLPSTVEYIETNAFYSVNGSYEENGEYVTSSPLEHVYCKRITPIETSTFDYDYAKNATLHVPGMSLAAYKLHDGWYKFKKILALDTEVGDITIDREYLLIDTSGLSDKPNLTIATTSDRKYAGHLTVSCDNTLSLGKFVQKQDMHDQYKYEYIDGNYFSYYTYPYVTSLVANSDMRADNVTTLLTVRCNKWAFFSLPYDVNVSDIKVQEGTMWVLRKYNSANRAAGTGTTWENVTAGQTLSAGEGYILHCINDNTDYVEFEFHAVNNSNKNNLFSHQAVTKTLTEYPAEFAHNQGWNLVGNPYPCTYSISGIDFGAPITVWTGDGYTAYSLVDDDYMLRPTEAFFVQCPTNGATIKFDPAARLHEYKRADRDYAPAMAQTDRQILNFVLIHDGAADRARLVINEQASELYEISCDASKFMSDGASQVYILDGGIRYAIDERPLGDGIFTLGMTIAAEGKYTLSFNSRNCDSDIILTDLLTGASVNLADAEYDFDSVAGTFDSRFVIEIKSGTESIADATLGTAFAVNGNSLEFAHGASVQIVAADGKVVYRGVPAGAITLPAGVYLINIDNETHKIAIK